MRLRSVLSRRPSPAIVISSIALFMSLGGAGYAATQLPANSVGSYQLRDNSVTYTKIVPGAVGNVRANTRQLQERIFRFCGPNQAISAVSQNGTPTCASTVPAQFGTTNNTASLFSGAAPATVTSVALPPGSSYLVLANPTATVTSGSVMRHVIVTCTLTVGSNTTTRSATVDTTGTTGQTSVASIPLQATGPSGTGSVTCSTAVPATAPATTVSVTSAINAIQIAG